MNRSAVAAKPPNVPLTADGGWLVSGDDTATIGELANTHHILLHELSPRCDSRYEVYTRMTGVAVLVTGTNSLPPDDTILGGALGNAVIGQIAAGAVGVLAVCGEYSSGTIRATLAACPRRVTVLIATSLVVAALMFTVAVTAALFAYQAGSLMLAGQGHPPGQPMPALLGIALSHAAVAILGVALGTAMRHTAGATTAITSILLPPTLLGPLLGRGQRWGDGTSPVAAMQKLAQTSDATPEALRQPQRLAHTRARLHLQRRRASSQHLATAHPRHLTGVCCGETAKVRPGVGPQFAVGLG